MSAAPENRDELIVAYLTGELDRAERAAFERQLARDQDLARELESMRRVTDLVGASADVIGDATEPPPLSLPVTDIPPGRPISRALPRWSPRVAAGMVLAGAAVLLVLVLVFGGSSDQPGGSPETAAALRPFDRGPAGASGSLQAAPGGRKAVLTVSGLTPSRRGDYYEAWLIGDGRRLLSLGTFSVGADGDADVDLQWPVESGRYGAVDVSLEPDDGDPSHSGVSVLRGDAPSA